MTVFHVPRDLPGLSSKLPAFIQLAGEEAWWKRVNQLNRDAQRSEFQIKIVLMVIAIVATDAPLLPGQCKAMARRVPLGLARTGTTGSHFSGDIFLAFSTAAAPGLASAFPIGPVGDDEFGTLTFVPWGRMDDLYTAVVHAVEEAVLNALVVNDDMVGRDGHRSPALRHERLIALLSHRP